jgi:hypothetical protein
MLSIIDEFIVRMGEIGLGFCIKVLEMTLA